jgi:hypothetical protein
VHTVKLDDNARRAYDLLMTSSRSAFEALLKHGDDAVMSIYVTVLECITRLRQACCDMYVPVPIGH